jgi:hypothetical protein
MLLRKPLLVLFACLPIAYAFDSSYASTLLLQLCKSCGANLRKLVVCHRDSRSRNCKWLAQVGTCSSADSQYVADFFSRAWAWIDVGEIVTFFGAKIVASAALSV